MHNNIKTKFLLLLALPVMMLTSSCKKYLYEAPIDATYGKKFWADANSAEQASNAMYTLLRSALRDESPDISYTPSYFIFGDYTTGNFKTSSGNNWYLPNAPQFDFAYVPYLEGTLQNWSRFYRVIAQTNLILNNVSTMSASLFKNPADRDKYIADALFVRAYAYFYITRVWGDPVYVSKTYDDVDYGRIPPIARSSESAVLDSCLRDLRIASSYQTYGAGDPELAVKANKGSSYALMAHIFAWKHNYDSTHYYCDQIINNGGYALEPINTYKNIWAGKQSAENIFEIPMQELGETSFNFFAVFLKDSKIDNQKSSCWIAPYGEMLDWFFHYGASDDKRLPLIFDSTQASGGDPAGYMLTKYTDFHYRNDATKSNPFISNNLVIFRLSDIYLLNAEALASKGDLGGARQNLRMTEDRAGIDYYNGPTNQYDLLDEIVMERGREFVGEGQWFYDMVRTDQAQGWLGAVGYAADRISPQNKGYYWPLQMDRLFPQDNLLTQNPWWATHK